MSSAAMPAVPPLTLERCDPGGMLRAALADPPAEGLRDLFLGWVLRLPDGIDAAAAAGLLLVSCRTAPPSALVDLLDTTATWPPERLAGWAQRRPAPRA
jgi:hypothetical protein